ncbi:MAG: sensor histidine kinase [Acidobacteria bacterium]|nr:sensor histidine kinase [Acidobacteriota bacterium]
MNTTSLNATIDARDLLLLILLVKILAAAAIASILARSSYFRRLLFSTSKQLSDQFIFGLVLGVPLMFGVLLRVLLNYQPPDLGLEGAILAGVLAGPVAGLMAGGLASLPALLHNELLALPVLLAAGAMGGFARSLAPGKDDVWTFSPFFDLNLYRWFRQRFGYPRAEWQMFFFLAIIVIEAVRMILGRLFPEHLYHVLDGSVPIVIAICLTTIACVAIPITIWKNVRNDLLLEEQRRLLVQARLDALTAQINPHFLFNTLNSIASLARTDAEAARQVIFKLSSILRKLLKKSDNFSTLREELAFIDDYLSIEVVRFGTEKLKIEKEIDQEALSTPVPSMLLQPIVENAIKHGLAPKVEGGIINIRAHKQNGHLLLEVRDNGVGISREVLDQINQRGIGISNVQERLRVLYGANHVFHIECPAEGGTTILLGLPLTTA